MKRKSADSCLHWTGLYQMKLA